MAEKVTPQQVSPRGLEGDAESCGEHYCLEVLRGRGEEKVTTVVLWRAPHQTSLTASSLLAGGQRAARRSDERGRSWESRVAPGSGVPMSHQLSFATQSNGDVPLVSRPITRHSLTRTDVVNTSTSGTATSLIVCTNLLLLCVADMLLSSSPPVFSVGH